ncbi:hypothetical protein CWI36_0072p0050 [Hamiltosporidium magnivora]|uniref:Uncharacterized protein n=1 Tax=Hamiltosporidium magnivora TaxID=148818 RepID=A0A4Q9LL97_9MICR|nr:hypothetical protein CWI36_0072p0050 [Hamiltosporidium magnivora]
MLYFIYITLIPLLCITTQPAEVDLSENRIVITNKGVYISKQNKDGDTENKGNKNVSNNTNNKEESVNNKDCEKGANNNDSKEEGVNNKNNNKKGVNTSTSEETVNSSTSTESVNTGKDGNNKPLCVIPEIPSNNNKENKNGNDKTNNEDVMECSVNKSTIEGVSEDIKECIRTKGAGNSQNNNNEENKENKSVKGSEDTNDTIEKSSIRSGSIVSSSSSISPNISTRIGTGPTLDSSKSSNTTLISITSTNLTLTPNTSINTNVSSINSSPLIDTDSSDSDIEIYTSCTTIYESTFPNDRSSRNTTNINSISPVITINSITSSSKAVNTLSSNTSPSITITGALQSASISKTSSSTPITVTPSSSTINKASSSSLIAKTLQSGSISKSPLSTPDNKTPLTTSKTNSSQSTHVKTTSLPSQIKSLGKILSTHSINTLPGSHTSKPISYTPSSTQSSTISSTIASNNTSNSINNNLLIKHANDFKSLKYGMEIQCIISQNITFLKKDYDSTIPKIKNVLIYKTSDNKYKDYWNILIFTKGTDNIYIDETKYFEGILVSSYEDIPVQGKLSPLGLFQSKMPILDYIRDIQSIKLLILQIANTKGVSATDIVNTKCNMSLIDKIVFKHMYKEMDGVKEDKCVFVCVCGDSFCKAPCVEVKCVDRNNIK